MSLVNRVIDGTRRIRAYEQELILPARDGQRLYVLRRFPEGGATRRAPVVMIHGLAQNRFTWDLPQRSLQNELVSAGFDTYNVELRGHSRSREAGSSYPASFEAYYRLDVPAILDVAKRLSGADKSLLVGHSLGGSVCYAAGVRFPSRVAGIISIGGPTHFGRGSTANRLVGQACTLLYRRLYPWPWILRKIPFAFGDVLAHTVVWNNWYFDNPKQRFPFAVWLPGSMEPEVTRTRTLEGWDRTSIPVFMTMMRWFGTRSGNLSDDDAIDYSAELRDLGVPILFAIGNQDRVAPRSSMEPGFRLCASKDKTLRVFGDRHGEPNFGHIDLICGRHAPSVTWPVMRAWLQEHAGERSSDENPLRASA